jgi:hypothetical protein
MTNETLECFNCGRANPEWAQVCRSCGVPLRQGRERTVPTGRVPTDRDSLISVGAVLGTIVAAIIIGLFIAGLNPTEPSVGLSTPTPEPTIEVTPEPSVAPSVEPTVAPTATPVPLPGTLLFGTGLGGSGEVTGVVDTFTPSMTFAYGVTVPEGFGAPQIENEVVRLDDDRTVVLERETVNVDPAATSFTYVIGPAANFIVEWGSGEYEWHVYVGDELVASQPFRLSDG